MDACRWAPAAAPTSSSRRAARLPATYMRRRVVGRGGAERAEEGGEGQRGCGAGGQRDIGRVQVVVGSRRAPAAPRLPSTAAVTTAPCSLRSSQPAAAPHPVPTAHSPPWPFVRLSARVTKRSSRSSQTSCVCRSSSNSSSISGAEPPLCDEGTSSSSAGAKLAATTAGRLSHTPRAGCARSTRSTRVPVACCCRI